MILDWFEEPDGDPGALLSVDVQEVRVACWDLCWDVCIYGIRTWILILAHFSLWMSRRLDPLAGTYFGMLPDWYKNPDGDSGALLAVDILKARAACWDLP